MDIHDNDVVQITAIINIKIIIMKNTTAFLLISFFIFGSVKGNLLHRHFIAHPVIPGYLSSGLSWFSWWVSFVPDFQ